MHSVLIVEDELNVCRGLSVLVDWEALGFHISGFVGDGLSAQRQLEMEKYDLLLCDIHIPGMNGLELIHWLRGANLPTEVIIISAYPDFDYARRAISDGVVEYILKPVDEVLLENALRKARARLDAAPRAAVQAETDVIGQAVEQIHAPGGCDLTTESLARRLYVSPARLNGMFRKRFDMSVKEYINDARMKRAKFLLEHTDKMIYEIAIAVGFQDIDYFTKVFKQNAGCTPRDWRRNHG